MLPLFMDINVITFSGDGIAGAGRTRLCWMFVDHSDVSESVVAVGSYLYTIIMLAFGGCLYTIMLYVPL